MIKKIVIEIHGREVPKLVNTESLSIVKDTLSAHWHNELVKLMKKK